MMYLIFVTIWVTLVRNGLGQSYTNLYPPFTREHDRFKHTIPFRITKRQYQDYPFSPFGGGSRNEMSRSNFPPQYFDNQGYHPLSSMASTTSTSIQPPSFYYYQDKPSRLSHSPPQPSAFDSGMYGIQNQVQNPSIQTVMTPAQLHSVVVRQPMMITTPQQHRNQFPVLPGFPSSSQTHSTNSRPANMDTYQEAINLFSEVVHKLEKETRPVDYGQVSQHQLNPLMSNGIYGSSIPVPTEPTSASGFPRHLDHIMGPDFLQRAQKLYTKIVKEQNQRKDTTLPGSVPAAQNHFINQAVKGNSFQGGPYVPQFENLMYPSLPTVPSYRRAKYQGSHFNFINSPYMEAFKSIEIPLGRRDDVDISDEMMQTAESIQRPMIHHNEVAPSGHPSMTANQIGQKPPPSTVTPAPQPQFQDAIGHHNHDDMMTPHQQPHLKQQHQEHHVGYPPPPPHPSSEMSGRYQINGNNGNDFAEHPLPYDEYEGLIRDILH